MGDIKEMLKREFKNYPRELLTDIQQEVQNHADETDYEVMIDSIRKAAMALKEAEIPDEQVIALLQKYWDLRRSEALDLVEEAKSLLQQR